jgi:hypothetical protein
MATRKRKCLWCSDLVNLHFQSESGRKRTLTVNLEEIWPTGALFLTNARISCATRLWIAIGNRRYSGKVSACTLSRPLGYFIEIRFDRRCQWSEHEYRPQHHFNPLVLLANRIFEATLCAPAGRSATPPRRLYFAASATSDQTVLRSASSGRVS